MLKELTGLVYRHIVSPHFPDVMDILSGERHEVLVDGDVSFSLNLVRIGSEQFKIGQQTSRNRILDCHDDGICTPLPDGRE